MRANRFIVYAFLIGLSVVFLMPLAWLVSTSLKPIEQTMSLPPTWLPRSADGHVQPRWENYREALTSMGGRGAARVSFATFLGNTLLVCVLGVIGAVLSNALV